MRPNASLFSSELKQVRNRRSGRHESGKGAESRPRPASFSPALSDAFGAAFSGDFLGPETPESRLFMLFFSEKQPGKLGCGSTSKATRVMRMNKAFLVSRQCGLWTPGPPPSSRVCIRPPSKLTQANGTGVSGWVIFRGNGCPKYCSVWVSRSTIISAPILVAVLLRPRELIGMSAS